jgi:hypothetical protein
MSTKLRDNLLNLDNDIWEIIDYFKDGHDQSDLFFLLDNKYDIEYEYIRNQVLYILDEQPNSIDIDWRKVLPHVNKMIFKGDTSRLSSSACHALNIVYNRMPEESYMEKAYCLRNIDYFDDILMENLFFNMYLQLKKDELIFDKLLPIYIQDAFPSEHGIGISLFLNEKNVSQLYLKKLIKYDQAIINFYVYLYITLYYQEDSDLLSLLPSYEVKGIALNQLGDYELKLDSLKFNKKKKAK